MRAEQVVEIEVIDGECVTSLYPPNEKILEAAAKRPTPPLYIARWMMFPDGLVPLEYAWANPAPIKKEGQIPTKLQRILWPQWLDLIEREKATRTGHIGPVG